MSAAATAQEVNKSDEIRSHKEKHPGHGPGEIREALGKRGIDVSSSLVSQVLARMEAGGNGNAGKARGGRRGGQTRRVRVAAQTTGGSNRRRGMTDGAPVEFGDVTMNQILLGREFINQLGGIETARSVLTAVENLSAT